MAYRRFWRLSADRKRLTSRGQPDYLFNPVDTTPNTSAVSHIYGRSVFTTAPSGHDRSGLVPGTYQPNATTAGYFSDTVFTEVGSGTSFNYAAVNSAASPQIVSDTMFTTRVEITGTNITFRNCWFRGHPTISGDCVTCWGANTRNIRFEDCTFEHQSPKWDTNGFRGWQSAFWRCEFKGVVDAVSHVSLLGYTGIDQNIQIMSCYFHDIACMSPSPGTASGFMDNQSHNDCFQFRGGNNATVRGNNFHGFASPTVGQGGIDPIFMSNGWHTTGNKQKTPTNTGLQTMSCIMVSPKLGDLNGLLIEDNWFNGSVMMININPGYTAGTGVVIRNNHVGRDQLSSDRAFILAPISLPITLTGNAYQDNGATANIRNNA